MEKRTCKREGCGRVFIPKQRMCVYCSPYCKANDHRKKNIEKYRKKDREAKKRWRMENPELAKLQDKLRYAKYRETYLRNARLRNLKLRPPKHFEERECLLPECHLVFKPKRVNQLYCCPAHQIVSRNRRRPSPDLEENRRRRYRYRLNNLEKCRASEREERKKRYAANPEKFREERRTYRKAHPDKVNRSNRKYRERHPEVKEKEAEYRKKYRAERDAVLMAEAVQSLLQSEES